LSRWAYQEGMMHDKDLLDGLLSRAADLRAQSARVCAKADRRVAKGRRLVTEFSDLYEVYEETVHARPRLAESQPD